MVVLERAVSAAAHDALFFALTTATSVGIPIIFFNPRTHPRARFRVFLEAFFQGHECFTALPPLIGGARRRAFPPV